MSPAVFAHGHLRLYLLALLGERPMHGYDLIQSLGDRFGGTYTPSAGTIYPRLAKLEDEGLVTKTADGRKTVYAITDAGRAEVRDRAGELERLEAELSDSVRRLADEVRSSVQEAMRSLRADLAAAAAAEPGDPAEAGRTSAGSRPGASRPGASGPGTTGARGTVTPADGAADARRLLREVDLLLNDFRIGLRSELRRASALGRLDAEAVAVLREGLDGARAAVLAQIR